MDGRLCEVLKDDAMKRLRSRYQQLATEVVQRLPSDWLFARATDHLPTVGWSIDMSEDVHLTPGGCLVVASVVVEQFELTESWTVTLHQRVLDELSDRAVRWVIAREFGYVAACRAAGIMVSAASDHGRHPSARAARARCADLYAIHWGFEGEKEAYEEEVSLL